MIIQPPLEQGGASGLRRSAHRGGPLMGGMGAAEFLDWVAGFSVLQGEP